VHDDPAEEDDDLEVELETVDVVSFVLAVVSLGFDELELESIFVEPALRETSITISFSGSVPLLITSIGTAVIRLTAQKTPRPLPNLPRN
jgi:hypothetical protein